MKPFVEKLKKLETRLSKAKGKGEFRLFALFLRANSPGLWDLLVSAPWIDKDKEAALRFLAREIRKIASPEEILKLSRIVIIEETNEALGAITSAVSLEHGDAHVKDCNFFGLEIEDAYIITSRKKGSRTVHAHGPTA